MKKIVLIFIIIFSTYVLFADEPPEEPLEKYTLDQAHEIFAVEFFNNTWDFLDKPERTYEENEVMLNLAHASLMHWSIIGKPINMQRGEWMVAHVYTILERKEPALHHAKNCLSITEKFGFDDFDLAFAYEEYARALALNDDDSWEEYYDLAKSAGELIKEQGDRDYFLQVLDEGPWFGKR
ncbi:MAG: hypothetical protein JW794_08450 [Candidatus Cloacimonetes bacterium]|nr:hypothetical protein [Candidatus Cloacimonadota bacterium]